MVDEMQLDDILQFVSEAEPEIRSAEDILLANLVLLGEIPASGYDESDRAHMLMRRFIECRLQDVHTDDCGNAWGLVAGRSTTRNLMVCAHLDTIFGPEVDHTVGVGTDCLSGPGMADNSLGVAALATLPTLLDRLDLQLRSNLVLLGDVKSLGRGNLEGMRFAMDRLSRPLQGAVCVEGVGLGRLSFNSVEMVRGEITCDAHDPATGQPRESGNAILVLNKVIAALADTDELNSDRATINLGAMQVGGTYNRVPAEGTLRFEVRSLACGHGQHCIERIRQVCRSVAAECGVDVALEIIATRTVGGLDEEAPLPQAVRRIHETLTLVTKLEPSVSELAVLAEHRVPAVTVGLTHGHRINTRSEKLHIRPIARGLAQLVGILLYMDRDTQDGS